AEWRNSSVGADAGSRRTRTARRRLPALNELQFREVRGTKPTSRRCPSGITASGRTRASEGVSYRGTSIPGELTPSLRWRSWQGREVAGQDAVADPAAEHPIKVEQRADKPSHQRLFASLDDQANHLIHAFLNRPDAKRHRRRVTPRCPVGAQHRMPYGRVHIARGHHADMHPVA